VLFVIVVPGPAVSESHREPYYAPSLIAYYSLRTAESKIIILDAAIASSSQDFFMRLGIASARMIECVPDPSGK